MGEISLLVFANGVTLNTVFTAVDCPSSYNVLLGRRWLHAMRAVPSTYHKLINHGRKSSGADLRKI